MLIENFNHFDEGTKITFDVVTDRQERHTIEVEGTPTGATFTNIDDFAENWSNDDYYALDNFIDAAMTLVKF